MNRSIYHPWNHQAFFWMCQCPKNFAGKTVACPTGWNILRFLKDFLRPIPFETILVSKPFTHLGFACWMQRAKSSPKKYVPKWWIFHGDESNGTLWKNHPTKNKSKLLGAVKIDHPKILGCPGQGLLGSMVTVGWLVVISPILINGMIQVIQKNCDPEPLKSSHLPPSSTIRSSPPHLLFQGDASSRKHR